jgi:hypothetical protein
VLEHIAIWENHNGLKPIGMIIHHIDNDKTNNKIENLKCVTRKEHGRLHSKWKPIV